MKKLNPQSVALVVGSTVGLMHLVWSVFVMMGWAQGLMDFIFSLHFLNNPFMLQAFDPGRALMLIIVTFMVGYVFGWVFTMIWNTLAKK